MAELISTIGGAASAIMSIIALVALMAKPVRQRFDRWVHKDSEKVNELAEKLDGLVAYNDNKNETDKLQNEAILGILRNTITDMYYEYTDKKYLPQFERENLIKLYESYHAMHGNSFVDIIYAELLELPTQVYPVRLSE